MALKFKLQAGDMLVVDNKAVLHGRAAFAEEPGDIGHRLLYRLQFELVPERPSHPGVACYYGGLKHAYRDDPESRPRRSRGSSALAPVGNDFPVNPASPDYCHDIPQTEYDPDKAAFYWKKTGLSSATLVVSNAANSSAVDLSVVLQEHAKACGIDIQLDRVPDDGYWSDVWMKVPWCADGWSSRPTADLVLTIAHQCDATWNETAWCNERFDELLVMGRKETDPARRKEIYCEAETLLHDDGGDFIPFFSNYLEASGNRVRNFQGSPVLELGDGWIFEEAWLDDSKA